jgi:hypothetical protein
MIRIELSGGLGNQLFGYFAGKSLSAVNKSNLVLDGTLIDQKRTKFCLASFDIGQSIDFSRRDVFHKRILYQGQRSIHRRLPHFSSIIRNISGIITDAGYDKNLEFISTNSQTSLTYCGYFQDPRYFLNLSPNESKLRLANPSQWFLSKLEEIQTHETVAIHLRFGDFLENVESIGILGFSFFASALDALQIDSHVRIWVFSDDLQRARDILRKVESKRFSYIRSPDDGDPAESLMLISKARAIVTANSTFSVWSALLSSPGTQVAVPEVFHRGSGHKLEHLPSTWKVLPSTWADDSSLRANNE